MARANTFLLTQRETTGPRSTALRSEIPKGSSSTGYDGQTALSPNRLSHPAVCVRLRAIPTFGRSNGAGVVPTLGSSFLRGPEPSRQCHRHLGAAAKATGDLDLALVQFSNSLYHSQPKTGARTFFR